MREDTADYRALFLSGVPMMDTRAPVEYAKGAFPNTVNLPLMSDAERERVGTCYKQRGQQAAIALGHQLVAGDTKAARIAAWADFAQRHPEGYLYCARGGLRSQIVQEWLKAEAGIAYPRVHDGYKAMRTFLIDETERAVKECDFVLIGGLTGTGKTDVLAALPNALDLEGHAHHRGSAFGKHATPQPTQIDFENRLAIDIVRKRASGHEQFVLEDEGRAVGSCSVPHTLIVGMGQYPIVWLEDDFDARVDRILRDYIVGLHAEFAALHGEAAFDPFADRLRQSLHNIATRLGGDRHRQLLGLMDDALARQRETGEVDLHRAWIARMLADYYDPMYAYQREARRARIEFTGQAGAVADYLRHRAGRT
ncbi:tRNA 2-selenouridine(34) synthase MnmH [Uliginosibacterium sp. sgz301328]|uniref:tRNA 2-selenouridine(34) synthase MnmH n=1 Tax=Uliginosibacterium sp. sgz301328 TaxID=3243764 RepID=UPI00359E4828